MNRKKGYFSISAVAHMFSVHQQTIRLYEREGLICPKRSEGNTRLFSEEDILQLEEIINLTHKLGINLAGVEMILKQQKQIEKLQKEINSIFERFHSELEEENQTTKKMVASTTQQITHLKMNKKHRAVATEAETIKKRHNRGGDFHE